ncbi:glycoside hydrolase family 15 protein [Streptomyces caatingaensis]|uniref:Glycoside hydrolase n=1 Tax=Streptomyces caatingaensis TaxID=1678637 RepID=A0A0K9XL99_9ACTN|nr:glycoside hydrolase family 15 protein [Streptomyces caatingaensis]KNB54063.1 glycoside hydrolase [Streptomyces caatingaensis]
MPGTGTGDDGEFEGFAPHPLRQYALLADGERGVLLGPHGDHGWMCAPRWDSDAVFSGLVGGRGVYAVTPCEPHVWGGRYEEGTLIWRNRWITRHGVIESREALAYPGDPHRAVVLRRVTAHGADARLTVVLEPRAGFGAQPLRDLTREDTDVWSGRAGSLYLRWRGCAGLRAEGAGEGRLVLDLTVAPGTRHDLVLEIGDRPPPGPAPRPADAWAATEAAWQARVPPLSGTLAPRDARHWYALLRGLTCSTGGMVAAATTSLPERAEEGRNYDYRYVWIRDQCFAGQAAAAAGDGPLLDAAVRFVTARLHEDGPHLAPAYTVDGRPVPEERKLDLPGYPGGFDRVGNRVGRQFQLDAFGEALLLLAAAARQDRLDADGRRAAALAADAVAARHRRPDSGIWELAPRRWTHSRLICAAGLRVMAAGGTAGRRGADWRGLADLLVAEAAAACVHPSGRWQRAPDDPRPDGALLLPPVRGAVPAGDPRTVATLRACTTELSDDFFAYRFRHDARPLPEAEGAFLLCGFVTALAEHQQGDGTAALRWFERNRAACGPPGLFSEEYDVEQRQMRGNLPQAFVHALALECAVRLTRPWREP